MSDKPKPAVKRVMNTLNGRVKTLWPLAVAVVVLAAAWGTLRETVKHNSSAIGEFRQNWRELQPQLDDIRSTLARIEGKLEGHSP
jgi:uncharacterized protein YoxC